MIYWLLRINR